jgi:hypothetical protein
MTSEQIVIGIKYLHPEAEFSFENGDYSTVKWDVLEGTAPTLKEIEVAYAEHLKAEEAKATAQATKKQEVLAKLGLTADEVASLLA